MARQKPKKRASKKTKRNQRRWLLPYPLVIFLLLCTGVLLTGWTLKASGEDVTVDARVPGPPVTGVPAITNLTSGKHFKAVPLYVSGTCPSNAAYVEIFDNNIMVASAICQNSAFDPQINLVPGENQLTVQGFNVTDDPGPVSTLLSVYYDAPATNPVIPGSVTAAGHSNTKTAPLIVKTAFVYKGYYTGQEVKWPLEISGGKAPYALDVDWGDGQSSIISRSDGSQFDITHTYKTAGGYHGSYTIKVQTTDAAGNYDYLQFFVIVTSRGAPGISGNIYAKGPPDLGGVHEWLWLAWPLYGIALLMAVSFKLGEREELIILRKRRKLRSS